MTINQKLTSPKASPTNYKLMVQPRSNPTLEPGSSIYTNQTICKLNPTTETVPQHWITGPKVQASVWTTTTAASAAAAAALFINSSISLIRLTWREEETPSTNFQKFAPLNSLKTWWWNQSRLSVCKCSVLISFCVDIISVYLLL